MIPTILITGFLGAGKTTLLNRLIEHYKSKRTVLLINEFDKVGIDGELLVAGNYKKIELNKGRPDPVASITLEAEENFTQQSWEQFRKFVGSNFMRLKGFISIDHKSHHIDATMDQYLMEPTPKSTANQNRLVLIGRKLNEEEIECKFLSNVS